MSTFNLIVLFSYYLIGLCFFRTPHDRVYANYKVTDSEIQPQFKDRGCFLIHVHPSIYVRLIDGNMLRVFLYISFIQ